MSEKELKETNKDFISLLVEKAIESNSPIETLKELMAMRERWEANEARKAFHLAMAEFKKNAPKIDKDKKVSYDTNKGKMQYNHATLGNITNKINSVLSDHGFSASWIPRIENQLVTVTCKITHKSGHSEEVTLSAPIDSTGLKNGIQAIASTVTYLERYTLLAITGLAPENDDDGIGINEPVELITEEQAQEIEKLAGGEERLVKLLKYLNVDNLQSIQKSQHQKAINALGGTK